MQGRIKKLKGEINKAKIDLIHLLFREDLPLFKITMRYNDLVKLSIDLMELERLEYLELVAMHRLYKFRVDITIMDEDTGRRILIHDADFEVLATADTIDNLLEEEIMKWVDNWVYENIKHRFSYEVWWDVIDLMKEEVDEI